MTAQLRFGLLGPLEVRARSGLVPVRAGKHRVILASLLLQPNRPVSIDELIDRLWGEEPVGTARATVHQYVMRLRQSIGGDDLIRTAPDGYLIEVAPEAIDLHQFEDLVLRGRRAGEQGDLASEACSLAEALALWRGAPLADIPSQRLQLTEVPRLAEQRLQVIERRVEVESLLGRHAEVIAELRALTNEHPLREAFWEQLIEALYRSGRRAEALAAFQAAREVMDDELGVSPGPRLRELHAALLAESAGTTEEPDRTPRQLPPDIVTFAGRAAELETLVQALDNRSGPRQAPVVVALHGPGGVGKSTLAIRAAHLVSDRFPDGQLYVDLQGSSPGLEPLTTVDVLGRFLRARTPEADLPSDEGELAARFRTEFAGRRVLLLLDNAAGIKQVMPLLPASSTCAVLVTSRQQLTTLPAVQVAATPLDTAQAIELLSLLAGRDRVLAESDAAAEVARWCGHSPLALRMVGARLAGNPSLAIATVARQLQAGQWQETNELSVRSSFDSSYRQLQSEDRRDDPDHSLAAARAIRSIGLLLAPEVTVPVVAAMLSVEADEAAQILEQLVELHLLEVSGVPGRYRMHDLLRLYSRDLATRIDSASARDATVLRAYTWYLTAVAEVNHSINGTRSDARDTNAPPVLQLDSPADAIDWLDAELGTLVALAAQAAERPELLGSWLTQVTPLVAVILQKRGRWHEARRLATLSVATARRLDDQTAESMALRSLATCNWRAGRFDEAEENLRRSLRLIQLSGDVEGEARAIHNLGWLFHRMGRLPDAIEQLGHSIELVKDLEPPSWLGMGLHNLGEAYAQAGEHHQAMEYLERSLAVRRRQGDVGGLSITLVALGRAYGQLGRHQEALEMLAEGLQVCRQVGNREDEWVALLMKSELLLRMRRPAEAEPAVRQALAISRRLRNPHGEAAAERQLAKALHAQGRTDEAEAAHHRFKILFADLPSSDDLLEQFLTAKDHQAANAGALHSPTTPPDSPT